VGLAPGRPSRVPVGLHVLARRRCPMPPLASARCTSPIMRRGRTATRSQPAHDGAACRRGRGACEVPPLAIGVRARQLSPYRAGLAGPHRTRLPLSPAFPTCSGPLWLAPSGKAMPQASPFALLLTVSRRQHRVPRRTVSLHPAQASQRPCAGPVSMKNQAGCTIRDAGRCPCGEGSTSAEKPPSFATPSVSSPPGFSCRDTAGKSARWRAGGWSNPSPSRDRTACAFPHPPPRTALGRPDGFPPFLMKGTIRAYHVPQG
jgi:hypothetical protein